MMGASLDLIAAVLCGLVALCLFSLHIVTSPRRQHWMTLPEYVRRGLLATGALFMVRSVNFTTIGPADNLGHINAEGILALVPLTYTICALTVWVATKVMEGHGWDRVRHVEKALRADPLQAPVMCSVDEVVDVARLTGAAAVRPGGDPAELVEPPLIRSRK